MKIKRLTQTPKVSVIIPCYNSGRYINEAVESVLHQTYKNFEIIIVDDASTDAYTRRLLKDYSKAKTRVYHLPKNSGPSAARNFAIEKARGQYILPLDADDKIAKTYMEKAFRILDKNPKIGIVYCRAKFFGAKTGDWQLPKYAFPDILLDNMIFATAFFRRSSWKKAGGYSTNMIYGMEDYDFWLSLLEKERCQVHCLDEILFHYRIRSDSRTVKLGKQQDHEVNMFTRIFYNHLDLYLRNNNMRLFFQNRLALLREINRLRQIIDISPTLKIERQLDTHPRLKWIYGVLIGFLKGGYRFYKKFRGGTGGQA